LLLADGLILYTEREYRTLVESGFPESNLGFANNTIDTKSIIELSCKNSGVRVQEILSQYGVENAPSMMFLGRLTWQKRLDILFSHYDALSVRIPDLQLIIVGDGPLLPMAKKESAVRAKVRVLGKLYDESIIAALMSVVTCVFVPAYAGLAILHAFSYGKPMLLIEGMDHGPEYAYLIDEYNGLSLRQHDGKLNGERVLRVFSDPLYRAQLSGGAQKTATMFSIEQMVDNLLSHLSKPGNAAKNN
jgi:glycosyltransferase involved in cell wall biosynthesis